MSAGRIFPKCFVRASPATDERNERALVFTGAAVNWRNKNYKKSGVEQSIQMKHHMRTDSHLGTK